MYVLLLEERRHVEIKVQNVLTKFSLDCMFVVSLVILETCRNLHQRGEDGRRENGRREEGARFEKVEY